MNYTCGIVLLLGAHWNLLPHTLDHASFISLGAPSRRAKCTVGGAWNNDIILAETAGASSKIKTKNWEELAIHDSIIIRSHAPNAMLLEDQRSWVPLPLRFSSTHFVPQIRRARNHRELCCRFLWGLSSLPVFDGASSPASHCRPSQPLDAGL